MLLSIPTFTQATDDNTTPCNSGGGCGDNTNNLGMTDVNSPTFNSTPTTVMQGSNTNINNVFDNVSRVGDVQCGNTSWSVGAYNGVNHSNNNYNNYGARGHSYGGQVGVSGSFGESDNTCQKALKASYQMVTYQAEMMKFERLDKNIAMCITMIQNGAVISDQLKAQYKELAMCDHFRILQKEHPRNYQEAVKSVQQGEVTAPKKKLVEKVVGYKEWRLWLGNFKGCSQCGNHYSQIRERLIDHKVPKENIIIIPFETKDGEMRYSVSVHNNFLTWAEAEKAQQVLAVQGFANKIRGVVGSEIKKVVEE